MRAILLSAALLCASAVGAHADEETDRLRDALRHSTVDLRAAEDSLAEVQANLDAANKQKAQLQAELAAAHAKAAPAPAPPPPTAAPVDLSRFRAAVAQATAQNAALRAALAKWQGAYQQAAALARQKDGQGRALAGQSRSIAAQLSLCEAENSKLVAVSNDILHLYRSQCFHQVLVGSYEPLIGLGEVKLENIVQGYEDKIRDQEYIPGPTGPAAAASH